MPHAARLVAVYLLLAAVGGALIAMAVLTMVDRDLQLNTLSRIAAVIETEEFRDRINRSIPEATRTLNQILGAQSDGPGMVTIQHTVGALREGVAADIGLAKTWTHQSEGNKTTRFVEFGNNPTFYQITIHWQSRWSHVTTRAISMVFIGFVLLVVLSMALFSGHFQSRVIVPLGEEIKRLQHHRDLAEGLQMVAHDLRKPLTMTRRYLEENSLNRKKIESRVRDSIQQAEVMIRDLLAVGRHRAGPGIEFSLFDVLEDVMAPLAQSERAVDQIQLEWRLHHGQMIKADKMMVHRILSNLMGNAVDAASTDLSGGASIWIESRDVQVEMKSRVQIRVGNTGVPIVPEQMPVLFKPFSAARKSSGTGLGLSIVKNFIELHGGQIHVDSTIESGTEFVFTLPGSTQLEVRRQVFPTKFSAWADYLAASQRTLPASSHVRPMSNGKAIVIVDDDPFVGELWLKQPDLGASLYFFASPEEAMTWLASDRDLKEVLCVITDYYFANSPLNGHQFATVLHERFDLPIFVSSAIHDALPHHEHVILHLEKRAFSIDELIQMLEESASAMVRERSDPASTAS